MLDPCTSVADRARNLRILALFCLVLACVRPQPVTEPPEPGPPEPPRRPATPPPERPPRVSVGPVGPLLIRVGLATDLGELDLPCGDPDLVLTAGEESWPLTEEAKVVPADVVVEHAVYRLQVAALKDERQAQGIADYLARATGEPADAVFDADTDLYKVRYGRFPSREAAAPHRERLAGLGLMQAWVTSEGGKLENPGFTIVRGGEPRAVDGRWLEVRSAEGSGIEVAGGRYRGRILVYLNDRGLMNLINELDIESYLRGVVPREMGPELYNQLEALKAQTVAARTYALRNLGEFSNEGYDICSTPRCQVYSGMGVEHRFSDRAIAETAGQVVLFEGRPAETFYGATCGGHTENVEVVFPLKRGEYLKGVPCMESGERPIAGTSPPGLAFPEALADHLLPSPGGPPPAAFKARLVHLAKLAGLSVPRGELGSLERGEVVRFLAWGFDMVLAPKIFSPEIDLEDPPANWRPADVRFAAYVSESGLTSEPRDRVLEDGEREALLYRLALYLGVLRYEAAHFLELDDEAGLTVRTASGRETWPLPEKLATFRRQGPSLVTGPLALAAGDRLEIYWNRARMVGLVQPVEAQPVSFGRRAPKQRWSRYVTQSQLRRAVETRYPGFPFEDFEVLARGVSGRVGKMLLLGQDGRTETVEGLAVRWTLDIPDTLFQAERRRDASHDGWYFEGRGWGHGVGMCQAGAFGMAKRQLGYREILEHYYTGVELGLVRQVRRPARPFLGP